MLKQIIALIILSTAIVLSMSYAQQGIQLLVDAHEWVAHFLTQIFSAGEAGNLARGLIALLAIPLIIGFIPTFIYWVVRRRFLPWFMQIVWVIWLLQAGALITLA